MKDDIIDNLKLTLEIDSEEIEIPNNHGEKIEIENGLNVTAEELRQIADLSDKFALWIEQMRNCPL